MSNNKELLKQILDPDHLLMDKFKEAAPGTYRHSVNVLDFCETIASELNLDVDILRVSAMYHDVGKMNYPNAFSENQNGVNMHDSLEPIMSYHIITRHIGDSILILLQIPEIPTQILNIISQHHGNTVLQYFYNKSNSDIDDTYRYKCKAPQSIEAAVLMICDSVEATAKALYNNGEITDAGDKKKVVDSTIKKLVEDDQLDEMKVGELKIIRKILYRKLDSLYHKREVYDEKTVKEAKDDSSFLGEGEK